MGNVALLDEALTRVRALACAHRRQRPPRPRAARTAPRVRKLTCMFRSRPTGPSAPPARSVTCGNGSTGRDAVVRQRRHLVRAAALVAHVEGWDRERVRLVVAGEALFGPRSRVIASLLPWSAVRGLERGARPSLRDDVAARGRGRRARRRGRRRRVLRLRHAGVVPRGQPARGGGGRRGAGGGEAPSVEGTADRLRCSARTAWSPARLRSSVLWDGASVTSRRDARPSDPSQLDDDRVGALTIVARS